MAEYKIYYTIEEVHNYLDLIDERRNSKNDILVDRNEFDVFGFKCIYNFCLTEYGWVASFEDCCPYCVHTIINHHGSKEDKLLFNKNHDLGERYNIPITRKEIALKNKMNRKSDKSRVKKRARRGRRKDNYSINKVERKELENALREMKEAGVFTLRRNKKNLWDDFYRYLAKGKTEKGRWRLFGFVYVKGLKPSSGIRVISSEKELHEGIKSEIERQNKRMNLNIQMPDFENIHL